MACSALNGKLSISTASTSPRRLALPLRRSFLAKANFLSTRPLCCRLRPFFLWLADRYLAASGVREGGVSLFSPKMYYSVLKRKS